MANISLSTSTSWVAALATASSGDAVNTIDIDAAINMTAAFTYSSYNELIIRGGKYPVRMSAPGVSAPFRFSNSERVVFDHVTFYGDVATSDGLEILLFCSSVKIVEFIGCSFYGLGVTSTLGNIIRLVQCSVRFVDCMFAGTFHADSGAVGIQTPLVSTVFERCRFLDVHNQTAFPTKSNNCHSWIHVFQGQPYPYSGPTFAGSGVGRIEIRNCGFDEAAITAVVIESELVAGERYHDVVMDGIQKWERGSLSPAIIKVKRADRVSIKGVRTFANSTTPAIDITDCHSVFIEDVVYAPSNSASVPTIAADVNTRRLQYTTQTGKVQKYTPTAGAVSLLIEAS